MIHSDLCLKPVHSQRFRTHHYTCIVDQNMQIRLFFFESVKKMNESKNNFFPHSHPPVVKIKLTCSQTSSPTPTTTNLVRVRKCFGCSSVRQFLADWPHTLPCLGTPCKFFRHVWPTRLRFLCRCPCWSRWWSQLCHQFGSVCCTWGLGKSAWNSIHKKLIVEWTSLTMIGGWTYNFDLDPISILLRNRAIKTIQSQLIVGTDVYSIKQYIICLSNLEFTVFFFQQIGNQMEIKFISQIQSCISTYNIILFIFTFLFCNLILFQLYF